MITRLTIAAMTTAFLAVSAYAVAPMQQQSAVLIPVKPVNSTVVEKNSSWPLRGNISMQPCKLSHCEQA